MIVGYFKNTKPINIVFLSLILSLLIFFSFFLTDTFIFSLENIGKFFLLLLSFFLFNKISKPQIISSETDYGILFYVIISSILYVSFYDIKIILANLLLLLALQQLFELESSEVNEKKKLFNFGFLLALTNFFFPLMILFYVLCIVAVFVFNKINWRNFLIPIVGFLSPIFCAFIAEDLFGLTLIDNLFSSTLVSTPFLLSTSILQITSIILLLLVSLALIKISFNLSLELVHYKNHHVFIITQFIIALVIMILYNNKNGSELLFLVFPISILLANYISLIKKKWIANTLVYMLIVLMIVNYNF